MASNIDNMTQEQLDAFLADPTSQQNAYLFEPDPAEKQARLSRAREILLADTPEEIANSELSPKEIAARQRAEAKARRMNNKADEGVIENGISDVDRSIPTSDFYAVIDQAETPEEKQALTSRLYNYQSKKLSLYRGSPAEAADKELQSLGQNLQVNSKSGQLVDSNVAIDGDTLKISDPSQKDPEETIRLTHIMPDGSEELKLDTFETPKSQEWIKKHPSAYWAFKNRVLNQRQIIADQTGLPVADVPEEEVFKRGLEAKKIAEDFASLAQQTGGLRVIRMPGQDQSGGGRTIGSVYNVAGEPLGALLNTKRLNTAWNDPANSTWRDQVQANEAYKVRKELEDRSAFGTADNPLVKGASALLSVGGGAKNYIDEAVANVRSGVAKLVGVSGTITSKEKEEIGKLQEGVHKTNLVQAIREKVEGSSGAFNAYEVARVKALKDAGSSLTKEQAKLYKDTADIKINKSLTAAMESFIGSPKHKFTVKGIGEGKKEDTTLAKRLIGEESLKELKKPQKLAHSGELIDVFDKVAARELADVPAKEAEKRSKETQALWKTISDVRKEEFQEAPSQKDAVLWTGVKAKAEKGKYLGTVLSSVGLAVDFSKNTLSQVVNNPAATVKTLTDSAAEMAAVMVNAPAAFALKMNDTVQDNSREFEKKNHRMMSSGEAVTNLALSTVTAGLDTALTHYLTKVTKGASNKSLESLIEKIPKGKNGSLDFTKNPQLLDDIINTLDKPTKGFLNKMAKVTKLGGVADLIVKGGTLVTEKFLQKIPAGVKSNVVTKGVATLYGVTKTVPGAIYKGATTEALEEGTISVFNQAAQHGGDFSKVNVAEAFKAASDGAGMGAVMGGIGAKRTDDYKKYLAQRHDELLKELTSFRENDPDYVKSTVFNPKHENYDPIVASKEFLGGNSYKVVAEEHSWDETEIKSKAREIKSTLEAYSQNVLGKKILEGDATKEETARLLAQVATTAESIKELNKVIENPSSLRDLHTTSEKIRTNDTTDRTSPVYDPIDSIDKIATQPVEVTPKPAKDKELSEGTITQEDYDREVLFEKKQAEITTRKNTIEAIAGLKEDLRNLDAKEVSELNSIQDELSTPKQAEERAKKIAVVKDTYKAARSIAKNTISNLTAKSVSKAEDSITSIAEDNTLDKITSSTSLEKDKVEDTIKRNGILETLQSFGSSADSINQASSTIKDIIVNEYISPKVKLIAEKISKHLTLQQEVQENVEEFNKDLRDGRDFSRSASTKKTPLIVNKEILGFGSNERDKQGLLEHIKDVGKNLLTGDTKAYKKGIYNLEVWASGHKSKAKQLESAIKKVEKRVANGKIQKSSSFSIGKGTIDIHHSKEGIKQAKKLLKFIDTESKFLSSTVSLLKEQKKTIKLVQEEDQVIFDREAQVQSTVSEAYDIAVKTENKDLLKLVEDKKVIDKAVEGDLSVFDDTVTSQFKEGDEKAIQDNKLALSDSKEELKTVKQKVAKKFEGSAVSLAAYARSLIRPSDGSTGKYTSVAEAITGEATILLKAHVLQARNEIEGGQSQSKGKLTPTELAVVSKVSKQGALKLTSDEINTLSSVLPTTVKGSLEGINGNRQKIKALESKIQQLEKVEKELNANTLSNRDADLNKAQLAQRQAELEEKIKDKTLYLKRLSTPGTKEAVIDTTIEEQSRKDAGISDAVPISTSEQATVRIDSDISKLIEDGANIDKTSLRMQGRLEKYQLATRAVNTQLEKLAQEEEKRRKEEDIVRSTPDAKGKTKNPRKYSKTPLQQVTDERKVDLLTNIIPTPELNLLRSGLQRSITKQSKSERVTEATVKRVFRNKYNLNNFFNEDYFDKPLIKKLNKLIGKKKGKVRFKTLKSLKTAMNLADFSNKDKKLVLETLKTYGDVLLSEGKLNLQKAEIKTSSKRLADVSTKAEKSYLEDPTDVLAAQVYKVLKTRNEGLAGLLEKEYLDKNSRAKVETLLSALTDVPELAPNQTIVEYRKDTLAKLFGTKGALTNKTVGNVNATDIAKIYQEIDFGQLRTINALREVSFYRESQKKFIDKRAKELLTMSTTKLAQYVATNLSPYLSEAQLYRVVSDLNKRKVKIKEIIRLENPQYKDTVPDDITKLLSVLQEPAKDVVLSLLNKEFKQQLALKKSGYIRRVRARELVGRYFQQPEISIEKFPDSVVVESPVKQLIAKVKSELPSNVTDNDVVKILSREVAQELATNEQDIRNFRPTVKKKVVDKIRKNAQKQRDEARNLFDEEVAETGGVPTEKSTEAGKVFYKGLVKDLTSELDNIKKLEKQQLSSVETSSLPKERKSFANSVYSFRIEALRKQIELTNEKELLDFEGSLRVSADTQAEIQLLNLTPAQFLELTKASLSEKSLADINKISLEIAAKTLLDGSYTNNKLPTREKNQLALLKKTRKELINSVSDQILNSEINRDLDELSTTRAKAKEKSDRKSKILSSTRVYRNTPEESGQRTERYIKRLGKSVHNISPPTGKVSSSIGKQLAESIANFSKVSETSTFEQKKNIIRMYNSVMLKEGVITEEQFQLRSELIALKGVALSTLLAISNTDISVAIKVKNRTPIKTKTKKRTKIDSKQVKPKVTDKQRDDNVEEMLDRIKLNSLTLDYHKLDRTIKKPSIYDLTKQGRYSVASTHPNGSQAPSIIKQVRKMLVGLESSVVNLEGDTVITEGVVTKRLLPVLLAPLKDGSISYEERVRQVVSLFGKYDVFSDVSFVSDADVGLERSLTKAKTALLGARKASTTYAKEANPTKSRIAKLKALELAASTQVGKAYSKVEAFDKKTRANKVKKASGKREKNIKVTQKAIYKYLGVTDLQKVTKINQPTIIEGVIGEFIQPSKLVSVVKEGATVNSIAGTVPDLANLLVPSKSESAFNITSSFFYDLDGAKKDNLLSYLKANKLITQKEEFALNRTLPGIIDLKSHIDSFYSNVIDKDPEDAFVNSYLYYQRDPLRAMVDADTGMIHEKIKDSIAYSAYKYASNDLIGTANNDEASIKSLLGLTEGDTLSTEARDKIAPVGTLLAPVIERLGKEIFRNAGMSFRNKARANGFVDRDIYLSLGGLAVNILHSSNMANLSYATNQELFDLARDFGGNPQTAEPKNPNARTNYIAVSTTFSQKEQRRVPSERVASLNEAWKEHGEHLSKVMGEASEKTRFVDTPPSAEEIEETKESVYKGLKGETPTTAKKEYIETASTLPHVIDPVIANLYRDIDEVIPEILYGITPIPEKYTSTYLAKLDASKFSSSKATSVEANYLIKLLEQDQTDKGSTLELKDQIKLYYLHQGIRNSRIAPVDIMAPTPNKVIRELVVQLDRLDKEYSLNDLDNFYKGIAFGLGLKVTKGKDVIQDVKDNILEIDKTTGKVTWKNKKIEGFYEARQSNAKNKEDVTVLRPPESTIPNEYNEIVLKEPYEYTEEERKLDNKSDAVKVKAGWLPKVIAHKGQQTLENKKKILDAVDEAGEDLMSLTTLEYLTVFLDSVKSDPKAKVRLALSHEIDGTTNGVVTTTVQQSTGYNNISDGKFRSATKFIVNGGLMAKKNGDKFYDHSEHSLDNYQEFAVVLGEMLASQIDTLEDSGLRQGAEVLNSIVTGKYKERVFDITIADAELIDNTVGNNIAVTKDMRKFSKYPVLSVAYNAGIKSVVATKTKEFILAFHSEIQEVARSNGEILLKQNISLLQERLRKVLGTSLTLPKTRQELVEFELDGTQERYLNNVVSQTIGKAISKAVSKNLSSTESVRQTYIQVAELMGVMTSILEEQLVEEALNRKAQKLKVDEVSLSDKELKAIQTEMLEKGFTPSFAEPGSESFEQNIQLTKMESQPVEEGIIKSEASFDKPVRLTSLSGKSEDTSSRSVGATQKKFSTDLGVLPAMIQAMVTDSTVLAEVFKAYKEGKLDAFTSVYDAVIVHALDSERAGAVINEAYWESLKWSYSVAMDTHFQHMFSRIPPMLNTGNKRKLKETFDALVSTSVDTDLIELYNEQIKQKALLDRKDKLLELLESDKKIEQKDVVKIVTGDVFYKNLPKLNAFGLFMGMVRKVSRDNSLTKDAMLANVSTVDQYAGFGTAFHPPKKDLKELKRRVNRAELSVEAKKTDSFYERMANSVLQDIPNVSNTNIKKSLQSLATDNRERNRKLKSQLKAKATLNVQEESILETQRLLGRVDAGSINNKKALVTFAGSTDNVLAELLLRAHIKSGKSADTIEETINSIILGASKEDGTVDTVASDLEAKVNATVVQIMSELQVEKTTFHDQQVTRKFKQLRNKQNLSSKKYNNFVIRSDNYLLNRAEYLVTRDEERRETKAILDSRKTKNLLSNLDALQSDVLSGTYSLNTYPESKSVVNEFVSSFPLNEKIVTGFRKDAIKILSNFSVSKSGTTTPEQYLNASKQRKRAFEKLFFKFKEEATLRAKLEGLSHAEDILQKYPELYISALLSLKSAIKENTLARGASKTSSSSSVSDIVERDKGKLLAHITQEIRKYRTKKKIDSDFDTIRETLSNYEVEKNTIRNDGTVDTHERIKKHKREARKLKQLNEIRRVLLKVNKIRREEIDSNPSSFGSNAEVNRDSFTKVLSKQTVGGTNVLTVFDEIRGKTGKVESDTHKAKLRSFVQDEIAPVLTATEEYLQVTTYKGKKNEGYVKGNNIHLTKSNKEAYFSSQEISQEETFAHELGHVMWSQFLGIFPDVRIQARLIRREALKAIVKSAKKRGVPPEEIFYPRDTLGNVSFRFHDDTERAAAQDKFDYVFYHENGLEEFLVMTQTNEIVANALSEVGKVEGERKEGLLGSVAELWNKLVKFFKGLGRLEARGSNVTDRVNNLQAEAKALYVKNHLNNKITDSMSAEIAINEAGADIVDSIAGKYAEAVDKFWELGNKSAYLSRVTAYQVLRLTAKIPQVVLSDPYRDVIGEFYESMVANRRGVAYQIVQEVSKPSLDHIRFKKLVRQSRGVKDQIVGRVRKVTMQTVDRAFVSDISLNKQDHSDMADVLLRTEAYKIVEQRGNDFLLDILQDKSALGEAITHAEEQLADLGGKYSNYLITASESLGHFAVTNQSLIRNHGDNAYLVANLFALGHKGEFSKVQAEKIEVIVDYLASLHAVNYTHSKAKTNTIRIIEAESSVAKVKNGVVNLMRMHSASESVSVEYKFKGRKHLTTKGRIKEKGASNRSYTVASLSRKKELKEVEGYVHVKPVDVDDPNGLQLYVSSMGAEQKWLNGAVNFNTGTARGVDIWSQYDKVFEGTDLDFKSDLADKEINRLAEAMKKEEDAIMNGSYVKGNSPSALSPLYNGRGELISFRYTLSLDDKRQHLGSESYANEAIAELVSEVDNKVMSEKSNEEIAEAIFDTYKESASDPKAKFTVLSRNSEDSYIAEISQMVPDAMWGDLQARFGDKPIQVRDELIPMIFGYRKFSITEAINNGIKKATNTDLNYSLRYGMHLAGRIWQGIIKDSQRVIVILTPQVLINNQISNTITLLLRGVPLRKALTDQALALEYLHTYQKDADEIEELYVKLDTNVFTSKREIKQAEGRVRHLKRQLATNPIAFLLNNGAFTSVLGDVDVGESSLLTRYREDLGKGAREFLKNGFDTIPKTAVDYAKNVFIARDTTISKKLTEATAVSDFTSRFAMFQHEIAIGTSKEAALEKVLEQFIEYDEVTNVALQYANDMGLWMFTKFLLRSQRTVLDLYKNKPANMLALHTAEHATGIDAVTLTDSFIPLHGIHLRTGLNIDSAIENIVEPSLYHYVPTTGILD